MTECPACADRRAALRAVIEGEAGLPAGAIAEMVREMKFEASRRGWSRLSKIILLAWSLAREESMTDPAERTQP